MGHDDRSPDRLLVEQVRDARAGMQYLPPAQVRFGPEGMHRIAGPLIRGQFWIVAGYTNIGKSTWVISAINDLVCSGATVTFLSLEMDATTVRLYLACLLAGVDKRIAEGNRWAEYADGMEMYERVNAALLRQEEPPYSDRLLILPDRFVDAGVIGRATIDALCIESDVLLVDHLDHLDQSQSRNTFLEAGKIAQTCVRSAEEGDMTVVGLKQITRRAVQGDRLARYMPPQLSDLQGGGLWEQNAHCVFGLYRPFQPMIGEDGKKRLNAARAGLIPVEELLMPKTLGVVCTKHRTDGSRVGERCLLHVENGRVTDRD